MISMIPVSNQSDQECYNDGGWMLSVPESLSITCCMDSLISIRHSLKSTDSVCLIYTKTQIL